MNTREQPLTIAAVLLGALTDVRHHLLDRTPAHPPRRPHPLDTRKLDAYETYVDRLRASIFLAVDLHEHREGIRPSPDHEPTMVSAIADAARLRGRAFERIMLPAGHDVVETAHTLNTAALEIDWQATGKTPGTLDERRTRNRAAFAATNTSHESARENLGVSGTVRGETHSDRDLLLPPTRGAAGDA